MTAPTPNPLCSECGTPAADISPRTPWWRRRLWAFQLLALLAYLLWFAWMQWRHWPLPPVMSTQAASTHLVELPAEQITLADLREMARPGSTASTGTRLVHVLERRLSSPWVPGSEQLHVALVAPSATIRTQMRWGWPIGWVTRTYAGYYKNVYTRTGMTHPTRPANAPGWRGWRGHTWGALSAHPTRGRAELRVTPWRASAGLIVLFAAWFAGSATAAILKRLGRSRGRTPGRLIRRLPAGFMLLALISIVWASLVPWTLDDPLMPAYRPRVAPTGLTVADLRAMRTSPCSDQDIAQAILNAVTQAPATLDTLAIGWVSPSSCSSGQHEGLWPPGAFFGYQLVRNAQAAEPSQPWGPTNWSLISDRIDLSIMRSETTGPQRLRQYSFRMAQWTWPVLGMFAAWLTPALPARFALWSYRRRRAARGDCIHCGYAGVAPTPTRPAGA